MWPTWGPPGSCRPQVGPMLAPRTLLSGMPLEHLWIWSLVGIISVLYAISCYVGPCCNEVEMYFFACFCDPNIHKKLRTQIHLTTMLIDDNIFSSIIMIWVQKVNCDKKPSWLFPEKVTTLDLMQSSVLWCRCTTAKIDNLPFDLLLSLPSSVFIFMPLLSEACHGGMETVLMK